MHLAHPAFTTTGKKKGKRKFASADAARKARALDDSWKELLKRHGIEQEEKKRKRALTAEVWQPTASGVFRRETEYIPSKNPMDMSPCVKAPDKVYTGTKVKGIGTMHKSNAVPIFSDEEAVDISKMRR
jgi:hypothetical protein